MAGSGELTKNMQGNKAVVELAQLIITYLSNYLNAEVGALYLLENDDMHLKLAAGYALGKSKIDAPAIRVGEGVVGQSAAENKTTLLQDIPKKYFTVNTGFGEVALRDIIASPLVFEHKVIGIIELGSIAGFTDIQKQFLNIVLDNIAIGITSSQSREKMKELLEETQRQAEELESQQEELRQINEELQEKTELLEKSEAELKAQQEELQQSNEELEEKANLLEEQKERLENSKVDLENKAGELEVTSRYKSEFLANMSHELRTPLNSILILAQLLSENKANVLGPKEVEFASNIHNSGNDLLNLINEILDLSKVESGKMELDIVETSFDDILSDVSSMFTEVAKNKSIDFKIHIDETSHSTITTDKQRLEQILRNLLSNAFKFTGKDHSVTLTVAKIPAVESFKNKKLNSLSEVVAFAVSDTGIGIPEDKLGIIFEAFQQADGSTKRKYGGTGLGLSISRELANVLGGEIQLHSIEGKGSTFTLFLPIVFDPLNSSPVEGKVEVKENAKRKASEPKNLEQDEESPVHDDRNSIQEQDRVILIMEDDPGFARILLDFVRDRHYKGIIATKGNTGLSYARHYKPDAIFLDMKLPIMDGADVLKRLKSDPELRHIPVQVISGYDRKKEGMELGAFDFVRKPVTNDGLVKTFDKIEAFVNNKLKKLLVVEDNENQNLAIRELIGNGDVKCFPAYSGMEAYEALGKEFFDCIIVDLGLPDMTGFELLEKIKINEQLNTIPVVVYTGKDLTREESLRLSKLANTVVLKTANSQERLLDETILFLHRVESRLPIEKQTIIRKLHKTDEVLRNKKVLVVDDDIRNIYSLTNALEEEGMLCFTADNGKAALDMIKEKAGIDIILMDVMMPEMDGYEATREIRSLSKFSKLPIIALTAKAMKGDKEKCLNAGMSDYIAKPVNIDQLLSLLRVWLYK
ncbi:MAG: response regulator [Bacteroidota bacterium]|nr:response regulator [Bacteroidota bacterium]